MSKKSNGKTRHVKKFMGGRITPDELHRALGIRGVCAICEGPGAIRIKVLVQLDELTKRQPEYVAQIMATNPDGLFVPTVATTYGPMVKVSDIVACDNCKVDAERSAAKGPSWALVEIDRGPGKDRAVVQMPN